MAEAYKERNSHTEKATIPGYDYLNGTYHSLLVSFWRTGLDVIILFSVVLC